MTVAESPDAKPAALPKDLLETIFGLLSSHDRRVNVPLVCKTWLAAVLPSDSASALWEDVEIRDEAPVQGAVRSCAGANRDSDAPSSVMRQAEKISSWLSQRRECLQRICVNISSAERASSVASWGRAFGLALPALATSAKLTQLAVQGPGVQAANRPCTRPRPPLSPAPASAPARTSDADAAGIVLRGAFCLPSLEELHVLDIPWAASLLPATTCTGIGEAPAPAPCVARFELTNLRRLVINRSFYATTEGGSGGGGSVADSVLLDGGATEAWAALGAALEALPHLERLDLSYTHAMTYCDPARGVAAAPWPALRALRELSLAHDLSVQPPPPPPPRSEPPQEPVGSTSTSSGSGGVHPRTGPVDPSHRSGKGDGGIHPGNAADEDDNAQGDGAACGADSGALLHNTGADAGADAAADAGDDQYRDEEAEVDVGAEAEADLEELLGRFGPPLLTIDAAHALVELHSWLPRCAGVTSLDLRHCGLEAVPLAVAHLPGLARLDLYGNPLVSMRLPGPLRSLAWLRLSLDPCYDMLYDMAVAEGGDAAAVEEEMWVVELPAPQLEELEVDSGSSRALGLIREATSALPLLRRLTLRDRSGEALR